MLALLRRVAGYLAVGITAAVTTFLFLAYPLSTFSIQTSTSQSDNGAELRPQTETIFLNGLSSRPDRSSEWWAARGDHALLAQEILNCKGIDSVQFASMPRQYYRALLLDLTPLGGHEFATASGDIAGLAAIEKVAAPLALSPADEAFLAISDSIARARITAADGASGNVPWVQRLGIATVVISAFATLFVTLQGRMRPVDMDDKEREKFVRSGLRNRLNYQLIGPGAGFRWVAFFAISLSIAGTSLAGLKQVYDPTRTLTQNTRALLGLRELHQEIVLAATCQDKSMVSQPRMNEWIAQLRDFRATILPEYSAYAAIDLGTTAQRRPGRGGPPKNENNGIQPPAPPKTSAVLEAPAK